MGRGEPEEFTNLGKRGTGGERVARIGDAQWKKGGKKYGSVQNGGGQIEETGGEETESLKPEVSIVGKF